MAEDLLHDRQALGLVQAAGGLDKYPSQFWGDQRLRKASKPQLKSSCQLQASEISSANADAM